MEQYSWMREALENNRTGSHNEHGDDYDERQSELIVDTVGGRTKAQLAAQQQQTLVNSNNANRQQRHSTHSAREQNHISEPRPLNVSTNDRPNTPARTPPFILSSTPKPADKMSSSSIVSLAGDSDIQKFRRKIEMHPRPGEGAKRLYELVQQPFRAKFGNDERVPSSAREIEHQRAASSTKPLISPFLRDAEPEMILDDSPRREKQVLEDHEPVFDEESYYPHQRQMDQQKSHRQRHSPQKQQTTVMPKHIQKRSTSTQTHPDSLLDHNQFHQQPRGRLFGDSGAPISYATDDNHHSRPNRPSNSSQLPPSPILPSQRHFYDDWNTTDEDRRLRDRRSYSSNYRAHLAAQRQPKSLSDYPPLYDFSRQPHVQSRINIDAHSHDPNHYRRRYIESLLRDIRKNKEIVQKLDGRKMELDEACQHDANELKMYQRERELLVRELELQAKEQELEERERRYISSSVTASPLPHPILKHYPNSPGGASYSTGSNRVNFANPICTAKEYTPNNSSIETTFGNSTHPSAPQAHYTSSTDRNNENQHRIRGVQVGSEAGQQHHRQSSQLVNEKDAQTGVYRCQHPLHLRPKSPLAPSNHHRVVLSNKTNLRHPPFLPPSPTPTSPRSHSPSTGKNRDVSVDRENESRRVAHEAEFRAVQQRVKAAAAAQRARGATRRPILRHSYNPTNPSSLFHFVPLNPQSQ